LPSLKYHAGAPWIKAEHKRKHQHPSPNDTKTNGVANGISSSSHHHASSSSFDKVSSFSSSSAKTDKTLSLRKPPALPLSSAGMFNSATDIVSNNQPSHVWRLTGSTASILPLMWTLDGGLMAPPVRSVVSTQSQQQQGLALKKIIALHIPTKKKKKTEVTTPAPAPVTKAQQPQKFVPSHSRSHSVAISALPAAVEETSHPLQAVQQPEPQTSKHSDEDSATETSSDGTPADEVDVASKPPLVPRQRPSIVHVSSTAGVLLSKDKPKPRVASGNDAVQPAIGQPSAESANTTSFVAPFFFRRASGHGDKKDFRQNRSSVAFDFSSFNPFSSSTSSSNVPQASGANDVAVNERQLDTIRKSSDSSPPAHGLQPKPLSIREDVRLLFSFVFLMGENYNVGLTHEQTTEHRSAKAERSTCLGIQLRDSDPPSRKQHSRHAVAAIAAAAGPRERHSWRDQTGCQQEQRPSVVDIPDWRERCGCTFILYLVVANGRENRLS